MKILAVYNEKGELIFTQTNALEQYNCLVEEVEDNKEIIGIDIKTNKFILVDKLATTEEKEQLKLQLEEKNIALENKEIKNIELTDKVIELTAQNLLNQ